MTNLSLKDISKAMRDIDICMMTTRDENGALDSRPMSNNRDVEYDGNSYFFAEGHSHLVKELKAEAQVNLSYVAKHHLYISVSGAARFTQDKAEMQQHWVKDLDEWFADGIDTPGLTMIHVKAQRIKYWKDMAEGEIHL